MKVYTKIVIDMEKGSVIEDETVFTHYTGPVAECKGGAEPEVDKEYNAGMLAISQKQQNIADEMFNYFKHGVSYNPYDEKGELTEQAQREGYDPEAQVSEAELISTQLEAQKGLIPLEVESEKGRFAQMEERRGVVSSVYKSALEGVDVEGRVSEHRAGVQQAFAKEGEIATRQLSRMGIDPGSGRGIAAFADVGLQKAKATALGETQIRRGAETEDFQRRAVAAGLPVA